MTDKSKPRRLSDIVVPGVDFAEKVGVDDLLGKEVVITSLRREKGSKEFAIVDEETGEVILRDYWNVEVTVDDLLYTFSTGAIPLDKKFAALQKKIDAGEAEFPVLAIFEKAGRTYVVS